MRKHLRIYSLFILVCFSTSCTGQNKTGAPKDSISQPEPILSDFDPYFVESKAISTSYGPSSIVRNITQDRKGNFWLAAWEGIIRYDGKSFTNFTNKEGLRRYRVFSVLEDSKGIIWFGTIGAGVYRYDGKSFTNITTEEGLVHSSIGCIYEDQKGNIWFGTLGGVSCYDGKTFRNFTTKDGLTDNDINSIIEDKSGKFWFGTRGDACFYDGKTFTNLKHIHDKPFSNVRSIIEDKKGNIWLGGKDGLWRYDGSSFANYTDDFTGYIYEDRNGNIWTSSEAPVNSHTWALSRYDEKSLHDNKTRATEILIQNGMFFGILEDKDGAIWFGSLSGVCRYDGSSFNYFKDTGSQE